MGYTIELDEDELNDLAFVAEISIFDTIRNDPDVDNIRWVTARVKLIEKLMKVRGEKGLL